MLIYDVTLFFPVFLDTYSFSSAFLNVLLPLSSECATPILNVVTISSFQCKNSTLALIFSANCNTSSLDLSWEIITNSSPPYLNKELFSSNNCWITLQILIKTISPISCPKLSFILLKLSKSKIIIENNLSLLNNLL